MGRLRYWIVPAIWMAVIWIFSTHYFAATQTRLWIEPLLRLLFPQASHAQLRLMHFIIRKAGHVVNYLILSLLLVWAIRRGRPGVQFGWAASAWAFAACYSMIDELHQAFVPGRSASWHDVLLDSAAAALGQVIVLLCRRRGGAAVEAAK